MGGHAFNRLHTPRMSSALYALTKSHATKVLNQLFRHVCVPLEMPSKTDHGDVDFLVTGPLYDNKASGTNGEFDYTTAVTKIKEALDTNHGRKGFLTEQVMYFAIPAAVVDPDLCEEQSTGTDEQKESQVDKSSDEEDSEAKQKVKKPWIQIDIKVCERPHMYAWEKFYFNYASFAKMIGSMVKPLGLTSDPDGLHIRVEGLEKVGFEKSMVFITKDPMTVLKVVGIKDRGFIDGGFTSNDEVYAYIASSAYFHPEHFFNRLQDPTWVKRLEDSPPCNLDFLRRWMSEQFPNYQLPNSDLGFEEWQEVQRRAIRDKVFAMFPDTAREYYEKRQSYLKDVEEQRLRELVMANIPDGHEGFSEDLPQPKVIWKTNTAAPKTPELKPVIVLATPSPKTSAAGVAGSHTEHDHRSSEGEAEGSTTEHNTPTSPASSLHSFDLDIRPASPKSVLETPIFLDVLPRDPPLAFEPRPPPKTMSLQAKLECIFRWTLFNRNGAPFLAREPRDKNTVMTWTDFEGTDAQLMAWVRDMWWHIWTRQFRVNYIGMWKKRMEKEDAKKEKARLAETEAKLAEEEVNTRRAKLLRRLDGINKSLEECFDAESDGGMWN